MTTPIVKTLACTALVTLTVGFGSAFADPASPAKTLGPDPVTVRYEDLNLASQEGARILYGRISTAARKVCGPSFVLWYPGVSRAWQKCYQATVDHAVKQVNSPALTALYEHGINVASLTR